MRSGMVSGALALVAIGCSSSAGGFGGATSGDAGATDAGSVDAEGGDAARDTSSSDDAALVDSAPPVDSGTGWLGDPCTDTSQCRAGMRCWTSHTPLSTEDMFDRCAYDCSVSDAARTAICEGYGGTCQSYQNGATDTVCVPAD